MSKRKRAIAKEKRQNSAKAKMKRQKQSFYQSVAAKDKWEEKKARKQQSVKDNSEG